MSCTRSNMDVDTNTGRGEQVTEHYLPGAGTNYERKKYRKKYRKLHERLLRFSPTFKKESTSKNKNLNVEQARKRDKNMMRRWQT